MNIPDVAGFTLKNGTKILENSGFDIHNIIVTAPPRDRNLGHNNNSRVLKVKAVGEGKVSLLVCSSLSVGGPDVAPR